jgi:hypothetical protein
MAASAQAFVVVTPRTATLLSGRTRAFQVQAAGNASNTGPTSLAPAGDWTWRVMEGGVGVIDPATGVYAAPAVASPSPVTVRAICRHDPRTSAEVSFLVVPAEPFNLMASVLGEECLESYSTRLPFLDPSTGIRFDPRARVEHSRTGRQLGSLLVGYGLPFTVQWRPQGTQPQLITYGLGHDVVRRDVSGETAKVIIPTDRMRSLTVESLQRAADGSSWKSTQDCFHIYLRGQVIHAGNPLAEPGHQDGRGVSARFREPFGLAVIPSHDIRLWKAQACLVTDPRSHVIRLISPSGDVSTPWGVLDQSGHLDRPRPSLLQRAANALCSINRPPARHARTRFNGPTFLTFREIRLPTGRRTWVARVADSGNHVIRELHPDGTVTTLAGTPGLAGHQDSFLGLAFSNLFNNPQGLAEDDPGNLYVADQGNCVIRVVCPKGRVRTLAGSPGVAGSADGPAHTARFTMLRGLAIHRAPGQHTALFAVDGHAIRRIDLVDGEVTTVAGVVDTPGFRDVQGGTAQERQVAIRQPCLNTPCGIASMGRILMVADQGNHAVRACSVEASRLRTLAGDPELAETRRGLVRDGMQVGLDERFAGLESPRCIAVCPWGPEACFVSAGNCVAEVLPSMLGRDQVAVTEVNCPLPVCAQQPCVIRVTAETTTPDGLPSDRALSCSVDFVEADGTLAERQRGDGASSAPIEFVGSFAKPGTGTVIVRCTTDQGVSVGSSREVEIAP